MNALPQSTDLGKLEYLDVYEFYDQPVLFTCRNAVDTIYLTVLVDETENVERWMYVEISQIRFELIRSGGMDLHDTFLRAENGFVYLLDIPYNTPENMSLNTIKTDNIRDEWLPSIGEFVKLETPTLPVLEQDLGRLAGQAKREYLRLALNFFNSLRTEAPAKLLGEVLQGVQETLDAIGEVHLTEQGAIGKIPSKILSKMEMSVVRVGAGSFEVELASSNLVDLFNESDVGDSLGELIHLISLGDDPYELREHLKVMKNRVASRYVKLLDAIGKTATSVDLTWASPNPRRGGTASISSDVASRAKIVIEQIEDGSVEEIQVIGRLIGANLRMRNYEIETSEQTFSGAITEEALEFVNNARLGNIYSVTIKVITTIRAVTGVPDIKYKLVSLLNTK